MLKVWGGLLLFSTVVLGLVALYLLLRDPD
jgi:hypothetical protein